MTAIPPSQRSPVAAGSRASGGLNAHVFFSVLILELRGKLASPHRPSMVRKNGSN